MAFPVPTRTDESGRFTAYVQLDQPGRYQLRMLRPRLRRQVQNLCDSGQGLTASVVAAFTESRK